MCDLHIMLNNIRLSESEWTLKGEICDTQCHRH